MTMVRSEAGQILSHARRGVVWLYGVGTGWGYSANVGEGWVN